MKNWRIVLVMTVLAMFCATLMMGCTDKKQEASYGSSQKNDLATEGFRNGNIHPGANIREYVDENGNRGIQYENPDGSGGGGVVID